MSHAEVAELTAENALLREEHKRLITLANTALAKEAAMREQHEGIIASRDNCLAALEVSERKRREAEEYSAAAEREHQRLMTMANDAQLQAEKLTGYVRRLRSELLSAAAAWEAEHGNEPAQWATLLEECRDV
jgi:hypothetical protein